MIAAVGVVIPARDEESLIGGCLQAVQRSLEHIGVRAEVCVIADRCSDATAAIAGGSLSGVRVMETSVRRTLGEIRDLGARHLLEALREFDPKSVWLLSTDADTLVPPGWVRSHLRHAASGADAVAGLVDLLPSRHLNLELRRRYRALVSAGIRPLDHDHVYGANLGIRASAFLTVGGYRPLDTGEDRDLWYRARKAGYSTRQPNDLTVRTSSRLTGRAHGGLADLLVTLISQG